MELNGGASAIDVSVVIPTFRRERQVLEAIGSALAETSLSIEVIVVDDSVDGSAADAVGSIRDQRVRYVRRATWSQGLPALVRNEGAELARGRYLHFLDDDDQLERDSLSVLSECLDATPEAGMAFGAIIPFGDDEPDLRRLQTYFRESAAVARRLRGRLQLVANLLFLPAILTNSACMARRECFIAAGGYDGLVPICEDVDLWTRIARATDFVYLDRPIVRYRTGAASLMHSRTVDDARLDAACRRTQGKYAARYGRFEYLMLKLWARTVLR